MTITGSFTLSPVDPRGLNNLADNIDGFTDDLSDLQPTNQTTLFVTSPTSASSGRCLYFLTDDGGKAFVPNTIVNAYITDLSVKTVNYQDPNLEAQDKLFVQFCTPSGEFFVIRTGINSWTASSLLQGLMQLSADQLTDRVSLRVSSKGLAVFMNVSVPNGNGFTRVDVPEELLHKFEYDEALAAVAAINQRAAQNHVPAASLASEQMPAEEVVEEVVVAEVPKKPSRKPRARTRKTADNYGTARPLAAV